MMISQATSQTRLPSMLDLGVAGPVEGGEAAKSAASGGFSALLAGLGRQPAAGAVSAEGAGEGVSAEAGSAAGETGEALASGNQAAALAATGKILPVALPGLAVQAGEADASETDTLAEIDMADDGDAAAPADEISPDGAALAALVAPVLAQPAAPPDGAGTADASAASNRALPHAAAQASAAAAPHSAVATKDGEAAAPATAAGRGETASAPSVTLHVAARADNSGDRGAQRDTSGEAGGDMRGDAERGPRATARPTLETAAASPAASTTPTAPALAAVAAERAVDAPQPFAADRPGIENQLTRELSRIVDSLASAREALSAKTATLALTHSEFGELSLRFDQRRDGHLAVQLAAADPGAHRAVAAAVAERPAFAQTDIGSSQAQQQAHNGSGNGSRGAAAERDGQSAGHNAPRQDRHETPRGQGRPGTGAGGGNRRSGVFA